MYYFHHYRCAGCQQEYDLLIDNFRCRSCGEPLLAIYDLYKARREALSYQQQIVPSMWHFEALLPIDSQTRPVTLGEGNTPVYRQDKLSNVLNVRQLYFKQEFQNPGGSYRDREMSVLLTALQKLNVESVYAEDTGTAGISLSKYCAAGRRQLLLLTGEHLPPHYESECRYYGANIKKINWSNKSRQAVRENMLASNTHIFDASEQGFTFRIEGAKTLFFELFMQFQFKLPEVFILPFSDGVLLAGFWKAISEFRQLDLLRNFNPPKIWLVQSQQFQSLSLFLKNEPDALPETTKSKALDLYSANTVLYPLISKIMSSLTCNIIHISDEDMLEACQLTARESGMLPSMEGGAAIAALRQIIRQNREDAKQGFLIVNPSLGLRQLCTNTYNKAIKN